METLKLSRPIKVNGEEINELSYDFEEMTAKDKLNASKEMKKTGNSVAVEELDPDYHFYLFAQAVQKANKGITIEDVMRISAKDAKKAATLARNFFYIDSEE